MENYFTSKYVMRKKAVRTSPKKSLTVSVYFVDRSLWDALREFSASQNRSMSGQLRHMASERIAQWQQEQGKAQAA
jgi:hypothetical protein